MRVLHISNHINQSGNGIVNVMIDLVCIQKKLGHQVAVASMGGAFEELLKKNEIPHYEFNQTRKFNNIISSIKRYRKIIHEFQPDVVHAHMMTGAIFAKYLKGFSNYKLVTTVHNEFQKSSNFMKVGDAVIAVSKAVADSMIKRGVSPKKIKIVLNGPLGSPRKKERSSFFIEGTAIISVAGLYQRKGFIELIEAFDKVAGKFSDVKLYIIGEGPDRKLFEEKAKQSNYHERILFMGFQEDPQKFMEASDIFVLASRKEPFGLVLIEAREAGCAIIASNVDGIPEALDGGEAGILVPPQDPSTLAQAISSMLENPQKLNEYKIKAKQGLEYYAVDRMAKETLAVYSNLL